MRRIGIAGDRILKEWVRVKVDAVAGRRISAASIWCTVPALMLATPPLLIYAMVGGLGRGVDFPPLYGIVALFFICLQVSSMTTPLAFVFGSIAVLLGIIALVRGRWNETPVVAIALGLVSLIIVAPELVVMIAPDAFLPEGIESW